MCVTDGPGRKNKKDSSHTLILQTFVIILWRTVPHQTTLHHFLTLTSTFLLLTLMIIKPTVKCIVHEWVSRRRKWLSRVNTRDIRHVLGIGEAALMLFQATADWCRSSYSSNALEDWMNQIIILAGGWQWYYAGMQHSYPVTVCTRSSIGQFLFASSMMLSHKSCKILAWTGPSDNVAYVLPGCFPRVYDGGYEGCVRLVETVKSEQLYVEPFDNPSRRVRFAEGLSSLRVDFPELLNSRSLILTKTKHNTATAMAGLMQENDCKIMSFPWLL